MIKEKIKQLLNKEGDNKKKVENLVFLLVILIITIIAINYIWKDKESEDNTSTKVTNKQLANTYNEETDNDTTLEDKLENILGEINGAGEVKVLLTYSESNKIVPVFNKTEKSTDTTEEDSGGGKRNIKETDISEEVVYQDKEGVRKYSYTKNS